MLPNIDFNLVDMIDRHARHAGSRPAFVFNGKVSTWSEFNARVNRVANALIKAGLKKGDRVCLLALNSLDAVSVVFGTMRAGGVIAPLSVMLTPELVLNLLKDSGSRYLFVDKALKPVADKIRGELRETSVTSCIGIGFEDHGWTSFDAFVGNASDAVPDVVFCEDDFANIIYSSGTTGIPKGIIHSHRVRVLFGFSMALETRINAESRPIFATPLFTNATWIMLLPVVLVGACGIMMQGFSPEAYLQTIADQKATHGFLVPTQYQRIFDMPDFDSYDLSSLKVMVSGGGSMSLAVKQKAMEKLGGRFMELYGLTEGVGTTLNLEDMPLKTGSVGTPIIGTEIRIIDDNGAELPNGQAGEIVGHGGGIMKGYLNRPEDSLATIWRDERGRAFLRTGDVGRLDEDGYLYLVDRKKDMIVSGGINVYPSDIEQVLCGHAGVGEAAVIGAPHADWGETPLAVVVRAKGAEINGDELKAWANQHLAKYQRISEVVFRDEGLPRNALGKVLKNELRQQYTD